MEEIKNFTNIDKEDFIGMYTGEEILVREGETKAFTETIAKHIAGQLATKMLIRDYSNKNYLDDPKRKELLKEMLGEVEVEKKKEEESEKEIVPEPKKEEEFAGLKKGKSKKK